MSKKNDNKKRTALTLGAGALAGAAIIGGTLAYLTDEEQATNTFTVGKVTVDLEEPNWPGNGSDKVTSIVPNEEIPKDPQTHNTGKNNTIVYMAVDIPMAKVVVAGDDGTIDNTAYPLVPDTAENRASGLFVPGEAKRTPKNIELFKFSKDKYVKGTATANFNSVDEDWKQIGEVAYKKIDRNADGTAKVDEKGYPVLIDANADDADYARRIYGYDKVLTANGTATDVSDPIFQTVKLVNVQEGHIDEGKFDINMATYAIQADSVNGKTGEDFGIDANGAPTGTITDAILKDVYDVYVAQSGNQIPADADSTKNLTLGENQKTSTMNISYEVADTHLELHSGKAADAATTGKVTLNYVGNGTKSTATITSSDPNIVTVSADGQTITAVHAGTAVITARATNPDNGEAAEAKVTITVQDMAPATPAPTPEP